MLLHATSSYCTVSSVAASPRHPIPSISNNMLYDCITKFRSLAIGAREKRLNVLALLPLMCERRDLTCVCSLAIVRESERVQERLKRANISVLVLGVMARTKKSFEK